MAPAVDFPNRDSLCEQCGYPLVGLGPEGDCPECGQPIAESSPFHRTGPSWQNRMTVGSWFATLSALVRHPKCSFRAMSFDGSNLRPRMFLLSMVSIISAYYLSIAWVSTHPLRQEYPAADTYIMLFLGCAVIAAISAVGVLVLTYIEIAGVTLFSHRRGWRVGFHNAERIACYASPGWIPAAIVILKLWMLWVDSKIERWWNEWIGPWSPVYALALGALVFGLAILGFEMLVWLGVRQAKYANRLKPLAAPRLPRDPSPPFRPGKNRGTDPLS